MRKREAFDDDQYAELRRVLGDRFRSTIEDLGFVVLAYRTILAKRGTLDDVLRRSAAEAREESKLAGELLAHARALLDGLEATARKRQHFQFLPSEVDPKKSYPLATLLGLDPRGRFHGTSEVWLRSARTRVAEVCTDLAKWQDRSAWAARGPKGRRDYGRIQVGRVVAQILIDAGVSTSNYADGPFAVVLGIICDAAGVRRPAKMSHLLARIFEEYPEVHAPRPHRNR